MPYNNSNNAWLTVDNPLILSLFNETQSTGMISPPPTTSFMITESGNYMDTEITAERMVTE